jgi:hypothetical protein
MIYQIMCTKFVRFICTEKPSTLLSMKVTNQLCKTCMLQQKAKTIAARGSKDNIRVSHTSMYLFLTTFPPLNKYIIELNTSLSDASQQCSLSWKKKNHTQLKKDTIQHNYSFYTPSTNIKSYGTFIILIKRFKFRAYNKLLHSSPRIKVTPDPHLHIVFDTLIREHFLLSFLILLLV